MGNQLKRPVLASEIASACNLDLIGPDVAVTHVTPLGSVDDGALCFSKVIPTAQIPAACVVIAERGSEAHATTLLATSTPRLTFAKVLDFLDRSVGFRRPQLGPEVHPTARVSPTAVIGNGVRIGPGSVINHFVVIGESVQIGANCVIKSGAVVGEDGFGFERDEDDKPIRLVHLGGVLIGDGVEIGSLTTVCRGTLADTVIDDFAKIDDHVHIAHNCKIGSGAMVVACAEVSGGVVLGRGSWVGPNASIIQQMRIGDQALVGIGANVLRDVPAATTVVGNPAKPLARR